MVGTILPDHLSKDDNALVLHNPSSSPIPKLPRSLSFSIPVSSQDVNSRFAQMTDFQAFFHCMSELFFQPVLDVKGRRRRQHLPLERTMVTRSQHAALLALPSNV